MFPWGDVTCCCLSAAGLYLIGKISGRDADELNSVPRVNKLKDLACKGLPLVVTVSGKVGSDTPINCECSGLQGVIVEATAEQHFLKSKFYWSWRHDSALISSMSKEVPWYLDDGTGRAFIVGGRNATGFELTAGSEVMEESRRSVIQRSFDYLRGLKILGVKRIERVLPTGTSLTVVGEAVKDDDGTIRIQRPHQGPFYISPNDIDDLVANLGKCARWYKYASICFAVFGVFLIASSAIQYFKERRACRRRALANASERSGKSSEDPVGKNENGPDDTKRDRLNLIKKKKETDRRNPDLCVVCLEREYNVVFAPCGHMCCCTTCSSRVCSSRPTCPICRARIEQEVKFFRP